MKQPMRIAECGEYRTRSGEIAVVDTICSTGSHPVRGHIEREGSMHGLRTLDRHFFSWSEDGVKAGRLFSKDDLVSKAEPPFEITEPGWYKTREGKLVEVTITDDGDGDDYPVGAIAEGDATDYIWWYTRDGFFLKFRDADPKDIVAKAEAPVTEPEIDVKVYGGHIDVGKVDRGNAFCNEHYIGCTIRIGPQEHSEHIFEDCIFEECAILYPDVHSAARSRQASHFFKDCIF